MVKHGSNSKELTSTKKIALKIYLKAKYDCVTLDVISNSFSFDGSTKSLKVRKSGARLVDWQLLFGTDNFFSLSKTLQQFKVRLYYFKLYFQQLIWSSLQ